MLYSKQSIATHSNRRLPEFLTPHPHLKPLYTLSPLYTLYTLIHNIGSSGYIEDSDFYSEPVLDLMNEESLDDAISHLLGPSTDTAREDPEVKALVLDVDVRQTLRHFHEDPVLAQRAMTNPIVKAKIDKLVQAGAISKEQVCCVYECVYKCIEIV